MNYFSSDNTYFFGEIQMQKQEITPSTRKDLLKRVKGLAVKRNTPISEMMTNLEKDVFSPCNPSRWSDEIRLLLKGIYGPGFSTWSRHDP